MKRFVVVGAGVAGCAAALELAGQGHAVTVLEASAAVGGKVLSYCCKATDSCARCGVCVSHDAVSKALGSERISFLPCARIDAVEAAEGGLRVRGTSAGPRIRHSLCTDCGACAAACPTRAISRYGRAGLVAYSVDPSRCLLHQGKACTACRDACGFDSVEGKTAEEKFSISADAAVIATGHETFDPTCKPRLGYRRLAGVLTGLEAESILSGSATLPGADGTPASRIAFVQCVGSRDPSLCRNFCSAVCCAYALRMARVLKARQPASTITVYCIDIQNFDKAFTPFRGGIEAMGVSIVRGVPSLVNRTSTGKLELLIEDPTGGHSKALHDAVVLSVGVAPATGATRVAELFGLEQDEFGFFTSRLASVRTAGTCAEPQTLVDAMASGRAAAAELLSATVQGARA
jgi:heterodisulfide reductase subunit A2